MQEKINFDIVTEYIKEHHLTEKEFCRQCRISVSTFYRIKKGEDFNSLSLFRIAKRMNIPVCRFFGVGV